VIRYVESGAGIGVIPGSVAETDVSERWKPVRLTPERSVPLVLVWKEEQQEPPARVFCELVEEWQKAGKLWGHR
jgi:DNA-binding transcriptional LysR family regulator